MTTVVTRPSPNFGARRDGPVDMLILHYTGMADADSALARLCDPACEVSSHYVVMENGDILQLVAEDKRAWHAGDSVWRGVADINSRSIGIEIVNGGHDYGLPDYPKVQIDALIALAGDIVGRWPIPPRHVLAHSDIAPARKEDPGEKFPWDRLAAAGIGHWTPAAPLAGGHFLMRGDQGEGVARLQALFADYGYGLPMTGQYDALTAAVVTAFQRHFRPARVDGIADRSTLTTLAMLIEGLETSNV